MDIDSILDSIKEKAQEATTELQEVNTLLTEIGKLHASLSDSQLQEMASHAFEMAGSYGKSATDYLSVVQEALNEGYQNAEAIAELSLAAQTASGMTAELANEMIFAIDSAYGLGGATKELTEILDGMHAIATHNAMSLSDFSEGISTVGSMAATFGIDIKELTAALAAMSVTTEQSISKVAEAFQTILLHIRQICDEEAGIDAKGLKAYEAACNALGVALQETRNGIQSLRDPMEILRELSTEYNKLAETDIRKANLLNSLGGEEAATQLDALLGQWSTYESMLQQYTSGAGSMANAAEETVNSWEGSLNRFKNTWTDTMQNIANTDAIVSSIHILNELLSFVNALTEALGSFGSIGLGVGLIAGIKNFGKTLRKIVFNLPICPLYLLFYSVIEKRYDV